MSTKEFLDKYGWWKSIYYNPAKRERRWNGRYDNLGRKQVQLYVLCECDDCHEEDWVRWQPEIVGSNGRHLCAECSKKEWNSKAWSIKGDLRSQICRYRELSKTPEQRSNAQRLRAVKLGRDKLSEISRKGALKQKEAGVGFFSEEVKERAAISYSAWCKENPEKVCCGVMEPRLWALGSHKVHFVDSYGNRQEIDALFEVNGRYYAVEEDDPSHREDGKHKPVGYHRIKDEEIMKKYGAPTLHIITPRCYDRNGPQSGFNSYKELIQSFITDSLPEGFPLIDLSNKGVYGDIVY